MLYNTGNEYAIAKKLIRNKYSSTNLQV